MPNRTEPGAPRRPPPPARPPAVRLTALLLSALLLSALAGCERVVSLTVPAGETRLVVEARLERVRDRPGDGRQRVRLTTTDAYFADRAPPPARGAVVRVRDDAGRAVPLAEVAGEPGVYATDSLPVARGRAYTLVVEWQGDRYEATDSALPVPPIDRLYLAPRTGQLGPRDGLRATIDTRDPAGERNFYLWDQFVDGARAVAADSTFLARVVQSDDLVEGRPVLGFQPYDGVVVPPGAEVVVRQLSLSESAYRYYLALSDQTDNDGSPFAVPPASVRGNVANVTRPGRRALGYFVVAEAAEARLAPAR